MEIDKLLNDSGVLYFKSNGNLTKEEIKELDNVEIEVEGKTKSQRLRNILYIKYTQRACSNKNSAVYLSFNDFYGVEMEKIMDSQKSELEPNN